MCCEEEVRQKAKKTRCAFGILRVLSVDNQRSHDVRRTTYRQRSFEGSLREPKTRFDETKTARDAYSTTKRNNRVGDISNHSTIQQIRGFRVLSVPMNPKSQTATAASFALLVGSVLAHFWIDRKEQRTTISKEVILALRKRLFSKSLSISYENSEPLLIVEVNYH